MALVTATGIIPTTLTEYVADLGVAFRAALGNDLSLDEETPQGQLISGIALRLEQVDEGVVAVGNSFSIARSEGLALRDNASLLDVEPLEATRSTVTGTMGGAAGTTIPRNSRVATDGGDAFRTNNAVTIPAAGTIDVDMQSVETGPVQAAIGALTMIVDVRAGWDTATNAAAASPGRNEETTQQFRARYRRHVARNARATRAAVEAALLETAGVTDVLVRENDTNAAVTVQGVDIAARAIYCVVLGGTDAAVARTIADYKVGGGPTSGGTAVNVPIHDTDGRQVSLIAINFDRVSDRETTVGIPIALGATFPSNGTTAIIEGVVAYVNGLSIGEAIDSTRILAPILAVQGHMIGPLTFGFVVGADDPTDIMNVGLADRLRLTASNVTLMIT